MTKRQTFKGRTCGIASLGDVRLSSWLPGLQIKGDALIVDPGSFPCCDALGFREVGPNDIARCSITHRIERVRQLVGDFCVTWEKSPEHLLRSLGKPEVVRFLQHLSSIRETTGRRGLVLTRKAEGYTPGPVWAIALMAAWRFGFPVHVVTLGRTPFERLIPDLSKDRSMDKTLPLILFVESVDRLWDTRRLDEFEYIVGWAYGAGALMWPEFVMHDDQSVEKKAFVSGTLVPRPPVSRTLGRYQQRIAATKAKSPFDRLSSDIKSKLSRAVEGLDKLDPRRRPRARPIEKTREID